jgi:HlyD family secretion protein
VKYTRPLKLKELEGDVQAAEAMKRAKEQELKIHLDRLSKIEKQINACSITAPSAGVVFYEDVPGETEEDEIIISEGAAVRRRQVILRLARLDSLAVRIEVAESDMAHLRTDMPADIYVDAMPGVSFQGHVAKIHPYPTRETRGSVDTKKYEVRVAIDNPSGTLRPGLTAEVDLSIVELDEVVQVPASSVFEEGDTEYCLVRSKNGWQTRSVVSGPSDNTMTVIREGLEPGEDVAIHPVQHRHESLP